MNTLSRLTNTELENTLKGLVGQERLLLHAILEHIREVDTRKLFLERAYSSMYEYLVKELQYSGSAAMRRIEAARLLKEMPQMSSHIQDGTLNLSQIGELSKAIKEKEKISPDKVSCSQKEELVSRIVGKSTQETQRDLAQALDIPVTQHEKKRVQQDESIRLELTLSKELADKLNQCRDLASHLIAGSDKSASYAELLEVLANSFIRKNTTKESQKSNPSDFSKANYKTSPPSSDREEKPVDSCRNPETVEFPIQSEKVNKTLTPKTKIEIRERDQGCQFVNPITGKKCGSRFLSQSDHKSSRWAEGASHEKSNLQTLCAGHNQLKYRKESGIRFV